MPVSARSDSPPSAHPPPPNGYVRVNDHETDIFSEVAFEHLERLIQEDENRCPDLHDIYCYNKFYGYAIADLMHRELTKMGKMVSSKKDKITVETFQRLEGITLYMGNCGPWGMIDDPEFANAIFYAFGSLWMTLLIALEKAAEPEDLGPLHPLPLPNIANAVRTAAYVMTSFRGMGYDEDPMDLSYALLRILERNNLPHTPRTMMYEGAPGSDEEDEEDEEPPRKKQKRKAKKVVTADDDDVKEAAKEWKSSRAMKRLKDCGPVAELYGRDWDITKWTKAELDQEKAKWNALL